jgi:hypothetical protein
MGRVWPTYAAGQKYVRSNTTKPPAEDREKPDDSPVTSGPNTF